MNYGTDRQGSVPPYSIARQFYSPHLYHASHFGLPYGRPRVGVVMVGRIGSLKTWVCTGELIHTININILIIKYYIMKNQDFLKLIIILIILFIVWLFFYFLFGIYVSTGIVALFLFDRWITRYIRNRY